MKKNRILITGASGFVGSELIESLSKNSNVELIASYRKGNLEAKIDAKSIYLDLCENSDLSAALTGVNVVIHSAARVHVMHDNASNPLAEFLKINCEGTLHLARQAASIGVKRFIFLSSIKVNGEHTECNKPFTPNDPSMPLDPYGISKMEAENGLKEISAETNMEVVIIRPVLVYGPNVRANFNNMMAWLDKGIPLPFGAIHNKRSLVSLDNLVSLIVTCIDHPAAANETFLVSDGKDLSTTELLQQMAIALNRPARLIPVPAALIKLVATIFGRRDIARRLLDSLTVDISKNHALLGWSPPVDIDKAFRKTAIHFLNGKNR